MRKRLLNPVAASGALRGHTARRYKSSKSPLLKEQVGAEASQTTNSDDHWGNSDWLDKRGDDDFWDTMQQPQSQPWGSDAPVDHFMRPDAGRDGGTAGGRGDSSAFDTTRFDAAGAMGFEPFTPPHMQLQQPAFESDPFGQPHHQYDLAADTMGSDDYMAEMRKQQQLVELEWEWETEAVNKSVQRYEQFRSGSQDRSALADMSAVEKIMVGWYPELLERIKRVRPPAVHLCAAHKISPVVVRSLTP